MSSRPLSLTFSLTLLTLLAGCIADNRAKQTAAPVTENVINMPPPEIRVEKVDTGRLVEDTAARVSQNVKTDMATNNAQLSGHVVAQLSKLEMNLKGLVNLEAKLDNQMYAQLHADLTSTMQAVASFKAQLEANLTVTNEMKVRLGQLAGQMDATVAGQAGIGNSIEKTMETIQQDIKARAGRDVNLLPPQAVAIVEGSYQMLLAIFGILAVLIAGISGWGYKNARQREDHTAKLLMKALSSLDPQSAERITREMK